jgi:hypothetical protein
VKEEFNKDVETLKRKKKINQTESPPWEKMFLKSNKKI